MIKVSVLYPAGEDATFNLDYYLTDHLALVTELIGDALKGATVEKGLGGAIPGSAPTYQIMANMYFDTMADFQNSFGPNAEKIMSDLPNFTNTNPTIQISEVLV